MKFGGTSVADSEKIRRVAARLVEARRSGSRVVGVVSAMGQHTDELVALAAALGADGCEIYTDVDGVFTADPRVVASPRKLHAVSYEEMLEMSAAGAKVLQLRAVEFARNHTVKVHVRSTFTDEPGTWIREEDERMLEKAMISGVTHTLEEAVYRVVDVDVADLFDALAAATVNVDTIIQIGSEVVFSA